MTLFYDPDYDFNSWHYRLDPTHVTFYSMKTFEWLAKEFELSIVVNDRKRVVLLCY